jgi:hypothetical protein
VIAALSRVRWGGGALGALLLALSLAGCLGHPQIGEFVEGVAYEVRPARLEPVHEFRVGRGLLGLAGVALSFADDSDLDAEQARALIHDLDAVHVGIYEIHGRRGDVHFSADWRLDLEEQGWMPIVRAQDGRNSSQWIFAKMQHGKLSALTVVSLDGRELDVVKLEGHLERSLDYAMRRDQGFLEVTRDVGAEM